MLDAASEEALRLLAGLTGVVAVKRVDREILRQVVQLESRYEQGALVPLKNLGVRIAWKREVAFALLKDRHFREPPEPTVYLVEEVPSKDCLDQRCIIVEGVSYRVVGEEVLPSRKPYREKIISLGQSFVIFPERRVNGSAPSYFLVPPLGFPELEAVQESLGIGDVLSISPSAQAESFLRQACGFPQDPSLATLLVAFNLKKGFTGKS